VQEYCSLEDERADDHRGAAARGALSRELVHEKERSTRGGLRFGIVEVLLSDDGPVQQRGLLLKLGAEAVARGLGVPLRRMIEPAAPEVVNVAA
jgi:hypothetical protein